jgi:hypothetical protein
MKLSVAITKKVGLPGFGSVGASCQLESGEFSSDLSAEAFRQRISRAFDACRQAVEAELRRHAVAAPSEDGPSTNGMGHQCVGTNRHGEGDVRRSSEFKGRPATPKQRNALRGMAAKSRLSRDDLQRLFGGKPIDALTVAEASAAIDRLKGGVVPLNGADRAFNNHAKGGA